MIVEKVYMNIRNTSKFLIVRRYDCAHYVCAQFMEWQTCRGIVRNYMGTRRNRRRMRRICRKDLDELVRDYILIDIGRKESKKHDKV